MSEDLAGHRTEQARLVVHDFSGHPFQAQLARQLAKRGFDVTHVHCASFQTPKGEVGDAAATYRSVGIRLWRPFNKYSPLRRVLQEIEYAVRLIVLVWRRRPAAIITANTPLFAAVCFQFAMWATRRRVVFWQQDIYSVAMSQHASKRLGLLGRPVGVALVRLERWLLRTSRHVVVISADFLGVLRDWGVDEAKVTVIRNWAPLSEVPQRPRPNEWSRRHGVGDEVVLLYAGTLGLKHQPSLLLDLAREFADRDDVRVIVASEGIGAKWLAEQMGADPVLDLIPFQPFEDLPDMLATADVLLVLLQPDAGVYSVPSKVMTYHCAARAILGSMPAENLASTTIADNGAGIVVPAGDAARFVAEARRLVDDPALRARMGAAAGRYATETFDIDRISDRFVHVLRGVVGDGIGRLGDDVSPATAPRSVR